MSEMEDLERYVGDSYPEVLTLRKQRRATDTNGYNVRLLLSRNAEVAADPARIEVQGVAGERLGEVRFPFNVPELTALTGRFFYIVRVENPAAEQVTLGGAQIEFKVRV